MKHIVHYIYLLIHLLFDKIFCYLGADDASWAWWTCFSLETLRKDKVSFTWFVKRRETHSLSTKAQVNKPQWFISNSFQLINRGLGFGCVFPWCRYKRIFQVTATIMDRLKLQGWLVNHCRADANYFAKNEDKRRFYNSLSTTIKIIKCLWVHWLSENTWC